MSSSKIKLSFTQCKQIIANGLDLRDTVEQLNSQPGFMQFDGMGVDSLGELLAIQQSGCASNAHRSAYDYDAQQCMAAHGDEVLSFIEDYAGELPDPAWFDWSEMDTCYLSYAIELWCGQFADTLEGVNWD